MTFGQMLCLIVGRVLGCALGQGIIVVLGWDAWAVVRERLVWQAVALSIPLIGYGTYCWARP